MNAHDMEGPAYRAELFGTDWAVIRYDSEIVFEGGQAACEAVLQELLMCSAETEAAQAFKRVADTQHAAALAENAELRRVLAPLVKIADAFDANDMDDEARKFWGLNLEHENTRPLGDIELVQGRGGRQLLTMAHCVAARALAQPVARDAGAPK